MRFIFLLAIVVMAQLSVSNADDILLAPFDKMPSWASNPAAVRVVKGEPSYLELSAECAICQEMAIPAFESLSVDIRVPSGKTGRLYLNLVEGSGAEYITPTLNLKGTGEWTQLEFKLEDLFLAPWSDDDNYYLDFPMGKVLCLFTPGAGASLQLRNMRVRGKDPRRPTAEYALVKDWIERLACSAQPAIPKPLNPGASAGVRFTESGSSISLKGAAYELRLDKRTGRIISLDFCGRAARWKPTHGQWWSLLTFDGEIIPNTQAASFEYAWDDWAKQLRAAYTFSKELEVILVVSGGADSFRCKGLIKNVGAAPIRCFRLPDGLALGARNLRRMVLPRLGGVELLPGYFKTARSLGMDYPSDAFSDFAWAEVARGTISIYAVQDEPIFWSSKLKLRNLPDKRRVEYTRETNTFVGAGGSWVSPSIVFIFGHSPLDSFEKYWSENGLDRSPTVEAKLGGKLFDQLRSSVLLVYNFDAIAQRGGDKPKVFSESARGLSSLPSPVLLHPLCYWNPPETGRRPDGGVFDTDYPDFLPPREEFGGDQGFAEYLDNANRLGLLVMPYINPTCWDKRSASYRKFGDAVGAKTPDGRLWMGWGMVTVTPHHPQVRAKNRALANGFTGPCKVDLLFEDQVGARSHTYDFSPHALHPAAYTHGLIQHAKRASAKIPLMTERGFDRLAPYESGFCGIELGLSCTTFMKGWEWDAFYGAGNWRVFPLETYFLGPHAALYHHDLGQYVLTKGDLSWCLAKGYNMNSPYGRAGEQSEVCDAFQKAVCLLYFGRKLKSFEYLNDSVTKTVFPMVTIFANHSPDSAFEHGSHTLAKEGCLALDEKGRLIAGVLTRLYGLDLGRECHIVQTIEPNRVILRTVSSTAGPMAALRPKQWTDAARISVLAVTKDGQVPVDFQAGPDSVTFEYSLSHQGSPVKEYVILYSMP
ncbi:MAG TPA: DUF6259 domain-containing protein [Armatimonadota bacterium]|nr:DUF6259 domain-containing protein [Armatimonadota bacterium]